VFIGDVEPSMGCGLAAIFTIVLRASRTLPGPGTPFSIRPCRILTGLFFSDDLVGCRDQKTKGLYQKVLGAW
jgi:hypothetical protein